MTEEYRVFGPPGTGKTTWLSGRIAESVKKFGSEGVIVASFTKTAAIELAGRDLHIPKQRVGTLHSFAYRSLGHPELADTPKWMKVWNDWVPFEDWRLKGEGVSVDDPFGMAERGSTEGVKLLGAYNRARTALVEAQDMDGTVRSFGVKWEAFKEEFQLRDFTDLILDCLEGERPIPLPARVGYFDEVQDFSPSELALVRQWGKELDFIVLAGDDDQCIFTFRGAVPEAFLDPPVPESHRIILPYSYRLPKNVKEKADKWIRRVQRREEKEFQPRKGDEGKVDHLGANYMAPQAIVSDALKEVATDNEDGTPRTAMFLASCSYMLNDTIQTIRDYGETYHNPYRPTNGAWNPMRGGVRRTLEFLRNEVSVHGDQAHSPTWASVFPWFEHLDAKKAGLKRGAKKLVKAMGKDESGTENEVLSWEDWASLGLDPPPPRGDIDWLEERLLESQVPKYRYAFQIIRGKGAPYLLKKPRLIVGTIHSVKGGQADVVYLFPDYSIAAEKEAQADVEGQDAITRMFYVGMTRPKERLVICSPVDANLAAQI